MPRPALLILAATLFVTFVATSGVAWAVPPVHYRYESSWPPGAIGQQQLMRGGPMRGYFQPVELSSTEGMQLSLAADGSFRKPQAEPIYAGMQIGKVYRLRVTHIPLHQGMEIYPTIEVIDRLYPPEGQKTRFPIRIQIAKEDVELALRGRYVMRVIYLENPTQAMPLREDPKLQRWFEVRPEADPLKVADELGRPVAILRLGSRVPGPAGPDNTFLFGSPPVVFYDPPARPKPLPEEEGFDPRQQAPALPGHESRLPNFPRVDQR